MISKAVMVCGIALGLAASPASAGQQPTTAEKANATMAGKKAPEETFVQKAASASTAEVELGRLAVEKAGSEDVKKFAQRMIDDHSKANDELKTLAQSKNITIAETPDPHNQAMHDRLSKLSGASFDRAYMQMMVTDHRKVLNDFRLASRAAKDPEIKGWATKTMPTIEEHLRLAQRTNTGVGTSGVKK